MHCAAPPPSRPPIVGALGSTPSSRATADRLTARAAAGVSPPSCSCPSCRRRAAVLRRQQDVAAGSLQAWRWHVMVEAPPAGAAAVLGASAPAGCSPRDTSCAPHDGQRRRAPSTYWEHRSRRPSSRRRRRRRRARDARRRRGGGGGVSPLPRPHRRRCCCSAPPRSAPPPGWARSACSRSRRRAPRLARVACCGRRLLAAPTVALAALARSIDVLAAIVATADARTRRRRSLSRSLPSPLSSPPPPRAPRGARRRRRRRPRRRRRAAAARP